MGELTKLANIGKILEAQLNTVGIETEEQLKQRGSRQTWLDIHAVDPSACYNRLCALEGAVRGIRWHDLSDETKQELKKFYLQFK